jgi:uncharacterized protein (DUF983 family)
LKKELVRAFRLSCPNCGKGGQLKSWLRVKPHCENCGLKFDRGEHDYFIGAYTINLILAELVFVFAFVIGIFITWPDVPWDRLMWALLPLAALTPVIMLPYARSVWLALDLVFRPAEPGDFINAD